MPGKFVQPKSTVFLTRAQVAEEFGFSYSYLAHIHPAELPFYKRGRKVLYERASVEAFIRGHVAGLPATPERAPQTTVPGKVGRPRQEPIPERAHR